MMKTHFAPVAGRSFLRYNQIVMNMQEGMRCMADQQKTYLFESAPIPTAVASLSVPTIISCLVSMFYSLADTYFVGMLNDPVQTAAVTLAATVLLAFNAVNNLFGVGSSSMMSRALGCGDMKTLRRSSAVGFYGALFSALIFSLLCTVFIRPLLAVLGADAVTAEPTRRYMFWTVTLGATPAILNVVMGFMIRSEGATLHASIGTMSGCVLNMILDPIFILPGMLNMGVEGAALATLISNCVACGYFFLYLLIKRGVTSVCISIREFTFRREIVGGICTVGIPAAIQNLLNVLSHTLLNNLAAPFGSEALAAMGIASKLGMVPWYIANGISQGVMPLIGYNYAANKARRMKDALSFTIRVSQMILISMAVLMCVFSGRLMTLFMDDPQTVAYGEIFLRGLALGTPFLAMDFLAVGVFQAVGKGSLSLVMAFFRKIVLEIPLTILLNVLYPLFGLSFAQLAAEIGMTVIGSFLLIRLLKQIDLRLASGGNPA